MLNSSGNKNLKIDQIMEEQKKLFTEMFGQGNVTAVMNVREVNSYEEILDHESLIEIKDPTEFKADKDGFTGGYARSGGKHISINANSFGSDN